MSASDATPLIAYVIESDTVPLWGLDGVHRLHRQLHALGIERTPSLSPPLPPEPVEGPSTGETQRGSYLLLRSDYLFDDRTLRDLARAPGVMLVAPSEDGQAPAAVAAHVDTSAFDRARSIIERRAEPSMLPGTIVQTAATLSSAFVGALLKSSPPQLLRIRADRTRELERHLFDGSYKGVTDLVTKWLWPTPARWATRLCVRFGITPNAVTGLSLILAILVTVLFARGDLVLALVLAWIMTFLDTVDGKLARVTISSTQFGHIFDHAIDLIHPPLWYAAWAYGTSSDAAALLATEPALVALLGTYVLGRLLEAAFDYLAGFSMFTWRPTDSYFRLITARRNPNLIILSFFAAAHLPSRGLIAITYWTVLSTIFLGVRLLQAAIVRARDGQLRSWLEDLSEHSANTPAYARPFIPHNAFSGQAVL